MGLRAHSLTHGVASVRQGRTWTCQSLAPSFSSLGEEKGSDGEHMKVYVSESWP